MGISIRDPEVGELARELARLRKTNMTEAIAHALAQRIEARARQAAARGAARRAREETERWQGRVGRVMTKEEIDELWGQ